MGRRADLRDPDDAARPLDRRDPAVRVLWSRRATAPALGVSTLAQVVDEVLRSEPQRFAVAILDSLLRATPLTRSDLELAAADLPLSRRRVLNRLDPRAESGSESVARCVLEDAGFAVETQVRVPFTDLDRIDLVVDGRIAIECDSRHHDDPASRERDAQRDLTLTALGFVVLRPRWSTLMFDPDALLAAVTTLRGRLDVRESVVI